LDPDRGKSGGLAAPFAVLAAVALAALLVAPRAKLPASFDGLHVYLPMARSVLAEGWAFLQKPESLVTAPLAFLYPALLGASEGVVRWANVLLFGAAIVLAYAAVRTAHSRAAGITAAFLLAISPTLRPYVADVLTEPPYFVLIAAWIACVAWVANGRSMRWAIAGGVALGMAALTRPAVMYFAPLMVVVFAFTNLAPRPVRSRLVAMHGIALAIIATWIVRNAIVFGFPAIATGAGAALYFGVNPLVDGFEPAYFGMNYDSGVAQDSTSHLSIHADRRLRAIALTELADTPPAVIAEMFARKAFAFLFVSSAESSGEPLAWLRSWRVVLVVLAVVAVMARRRSVGGGEPRDPHRLHARGAPAGLLQPSLQRGRDRPAAHAARRGRRGGGGAQRKDGGGGARRDRVRPGPGAPRRVARRASRAEARSHSARSDVARARGLVVLGGTGTRSDRHPHRQERRYAALGPLHAADRPHRHRRSQGGWFAPRWWCASGPRSWIAFPRAAP
jgi:hypothetical protein